MKFDTIVLGAGMVGVSVAVHLQQRGRAVALIDRRAPGEETSYGNAGLIQAEGVYPYAFPRALADILHYAGNRSPDVRYDFTALPALLPFLARYWWHSQPARHAAIAHTYATLIRACVAEHRALASAAGAEALIRPGGWLKVFRTARVRDAETQEATRHLGEFGIPFDILDAAALRRAEPHLGEGLLGGLRYTTAESVRDPGALVKACADYFCRLGGRLLRGDAATLGEGWRVRTEAGEASAREVVIALGPWSGALTRRLGYRLPLAVKRGYHMHYAAQPPARLNLPVLDAEGGYLLAPMARGIRLTTGVEFARLDAAPSPRQLEAVEPVARQLFPLGERVDAQAWMGARPCTADMLPVIGPASRHPGLWFAFGHAHHGLTLGPATGRLLAEMMTGEAPFTDPAGFSAARF